MASKSSLWGLGRWFRTLPATWQFVAFVFPAASATGTAVVSRMIESIAWHQVLFVSFGVFAFASVGAITIARFARESDLRYKLVPTNFVPHVLWARGTRWRLDTISNSPTIQNFPCNSRSMNFQLCCKAGLESSRRTESLLMWLLREEPHCSLCQTYKTWIARSRLKEW